MKTAAVSKKRTRRQHRDFNQLPDSALIYLHELVKDPRDPDRVPALPFSAATLWRNIDDERFPRPVYKRCGWLLGDVREWMRAWDALELPPPDSAQSTTKLFSAAPLSARGGNVDSVRRVQRPGVTPVTEGCDAATPDVPVHDHCQGDAGGQMELAQVRSGQGADAAQTESTGSAMAREPYDVRELLRSISEGVAHE